MATILEPKAADQPAAIGSDCSFGFEFAAVFSIIGVWPLMRHDTPHRWALGIAVAFALAALAAPHLLHPLNRAWMAFGRLLHAPGGCLLHSDDDSHGAVFCRRGFGRS